MVLSPQVDLGFLRFVSAIGTQGAISQETKKKYYVKTYKVDVSSNGEDWITIKDGPKQKVTCLIISIKLQCMHCLKNWLIYRFNQCWHAGPQKQKALCKNYYMHFDNNVDSAFKLPL